MGAEQGQKATTWFSRWRERRRSKAERARAIQRRAKAARSRNHPSGPGGGDAGAIGGGGF